MRSGILTLMGEYRACDTQESPPYLPDVADVPEPEKSSTREGKSRNWKREWFAREQVRQLVRQVFLRDDPLAPRQVVFSAVDADTGLAGVCRQIAQTLALQVSSSVALVDAQLESALFDGLETSRKLWTPLLRTPERQISSNLWQISAEAFWAMGSGEVSAALARERISDLQNEFDYAVIQAPAAACSSMATLLASKCDGMVLVLEANLTRKLAAQSVKNMLQNAEVKLLGTVLSGRTFPIPEPIYRRL